MTHLSRLSILLVSLVSLALPASAQLMIVGNDEKASWDDNGKLVLSPPGKDTVCIVDIKNPLAPRIVATLPLTNSVFGPPVNLAITPDERLAIVANSLEVVTDEKGALKNQPADQLYVIDLKADPPKVIDTLHIGKQPSGLSINAKGDLALVANREDKSISVLSIAGTEVKLIETVPMGDSVAHVAFTPDGKHALAAKFPMHKIAVLDVDGQKVTYNKLDLWAGLWPYNVQVVPGGLIALTADNGNAGASDGSVDTVSVIDMTGPQPHVIDKVVVGDGPEGLAVSPTGKVAVAMILNGSNAAKSAFFHHRNGIVTVLKIDGKKVSKAGQVEVGGLPEGAVFSPDGKWLYVGNFLDGDVSILKVAGSRITDTGKKLKLPGHPASMRGRAF